MDSTTTQTCSPYIIKYGEHEIKVNPRDLSYVSEKFKRLYEENPDFLEVDETTEDFRIFLIFITTAQRLPFQPHNYWATRIAQLAEDWEAESVKNLILENYKEVDPTEAVTELINAEDEESKKKAIKNAALALPEILDDERLWEDLSMLDIYQILDKAEEEGFESKDLVPFVVKNFEQDPARMIPLVLRIDFDVLTDEEYDMIFSRPEIHEQNVNFFTAASMSAINQVANTEIKGYEKGFKKASEKRNEVKHKEKEDKLLESIKGERGKDLQRMKKKLDAQQDIIDDLNRALEEQRKELKNSISRSHTSKSNDELLRDAQEELSRLLEEGRNKALEMIEDDEADETAALNEMLREATDRLNQTMEGLEDVPEDITNRISEYTESFANINERLDKVSSELTDAHSLMVAKIIHDKLKQDDFLRKTERRFEFIEDEEEKKRVEDAEQKIKELEEDLEKRCPIINKKRANNNAQNGNQNENSENGHNEESTNEGSGSGSGSGNEDQNNSDNDSNEA